MKSIVMTGGGTSGHVTPNIALIQKLKTQGYSIAYIGSKTGIEKQLIENEGISYYGINAGKLRRYFDPKNFSDMFRVMDGFREAFFLLGKLKPGIVFSKGGFVSCPVVWAAWLRGIPVIIHESDYTPGLTNKLSIPFAKKICYTFPETREYLPPDKAVLTGIPIRESLLSGDPAQGMKISGFQDLKPVILIVGGSQGAESINGITRESLDTLLKDFNICHLCGKGNVISSFDGKRGYKQMEYADKELPHLFAMADMLVSRAGATVLFEILELRKPNLLIPLSKRASRGDQILNAGSFEKLGFSQVLFEENLNPDVYVSKINDVYSKRKEYRTAMEIRSTQNAVEAVVKLIEENEKRA